VIEVSPRTAPDALPPVAMQSHRRTFDRTVIAKLSDARERLHVLLERAREEREASNTDIWPRDINAPDEEVSRG